MNKFLTNLSRVVIIGLIIFEFLNMVKILNFTINYTWSGSLIVSFSVFIFIESIAYFSRKKTGHNVPAFIFVAAAIGLNMDFIGDKFFLFNKLEYYDRIVHFSAGGMLGGGIIFIIIHELEKAGIIKLGMLGIGFFSWMTTNFFGILNELVEYFEDVLTGSHRLGDGFDTADDLFLNMVGGLCIILILTLYYHLKKKKLDLKSV
ncbi:MAG: hypothetical protein A2174_02745 [Candidatus Portnoybacteria bacterium RBG_13_41_18]|uniref:DUF2238 domain-containing protein n=1 Tax=Candidatus Portnoybacteria bacterium RBG_13_41_18 TaxID=1801991 RepID=A0A1G2F918_9BACT|nr:MAG: hypothetical protein A2174_02745 [Candidatus Portnoybacteria bacterium RBG_13_41_18]